MGNDTVLVVARYKEDLVWLRDVPDEIDIIVYNKGPGTLMVPRGVVVSLPNIGREADTYCQHIVRNYKRLHRRTIFCQGDPFTHAPHFLEALHSRDQWSEFQPLTMRYLEDPPIPPPTVVELHGGSGPNYTERMSCYTLDSIYFKDVGVQKLCGAYLEEHKLPVGTNIMHHHMTQCGLKALLPVTTEVISFNYAAMFCVSLRMITQHRLSTFKNIIAKLGSNHWVEASICERMWMLLFDATSALKIPECTVHDVTTEEGPV